MHKKEKNTAISSLKIITQIVSQITIYESLKLFQTLVNKIQSDTEMWLMGGNTSEQKIYIPFQKLWV